MANGSLLALVSLVLSAGVCALQLHVVAGAPAPDGTPPVLWVGNTRQAAVEGRVEMALALTTCLWAYVPNLIMIELAVEVREIRRARKAPLRFFAERPDRPDPPPSALPLLTPSRRWSGRSACGARSGCRPRSTSASSSRSACRSRSAGAATSATPSRSRRRGRRARRPRAARASCSRSRTASRTRSTRSRSRASASACGRPTLTTAGARATSSRAADAREKRRVSLASPFLAPPPGSPPRPAATAARARPARLTRARARLVRAPLNPPLKTLP